MKKKLFGLLTLTLFLLSASACGSTQTRSPLPPASAADSKALAAEPKKALIVYFSWSGNTRAVAEEIQKQTGAALFELSPKTPYTKEYDTLLNVAKRERQSNTRPALASVPNALEDYDVVFLGFPNWWSDMPMLLYTFLETQPLSGKTIVPFCTSGGSGFSRTIDAIKATQPDATVLSGLHVRSSGAANSADAVSKWLGELGLSQQRAAK